MKKQRITASLEDYLETIFHLVEKHHAARPIDISKEMNVGKSSVTEALRSLAEKKLINYEPYSKVTLTYQGQKVAQEVVLKHKILYDFLHEILGVDKQEAKKNACEIEHVISENVLEKLVDFIEFSKELYGKDQNIAEEFKKFSKKKEG